MSWLVAVLGLQSDGRFAESLFQCAPGSVLVRALLCVLVSGSGWNPCIARGELPDALVRDAENPRGVAVHRPQQNMNLIYICESVFWWNPGRIKSSTTSSRWVRREVKLTTIGC